MAIGPESASVRSRKKSRFSAKSSRNRGENLRVRSTLLVLKVETLQHFGRIVHRRNIVILALQEMQIMD
jgi:hypothetical protein